MTPKATERSAWPSTAKVPDTWTVSAIESGELEDRILAILNVGSSKYSPSTSSSLLFMSSCGEFEEGDRVTVKVEKITYQSQESSEK